ncbi:MAG: hypothetical protein ACHQUC_09140 [Chlamydiales bacterium]
MLIRLGVPNKALVVCQSLFGKAKPQLLSHYRADETLALHAFIFYCRLLSRFKQGRIKGFYKESFYRSTAARIQGAAKKCELRHLCSIVESCAVARIRDTSLFRTIARAVIAFEDREVIDNMQILIDITGRTLLGKDLLKNVLISHGWRLHRIEARRVNATSLQRLRTAIITNS